MPVPNTLYFIVKISYLAQYFRQVRNDIHRTLSDLWCLDPIGNNQAILINQIMVPTIRITSQITQIIARSEEFPAMIPKIYHARRMNVMLAVQSSNNERRRNSRIRNTGHIVLFLYGLV